MTNLDWGSVGQFRLRASLTAIIKPRSPELRAPSRYPQLDDGSPGTL